jgi:WD40 repeat protein
MAYLENENIITAIFKNFSLLHTSQFSKTVFNKTINTAILKILNLKNIYKLLGRTKNMLNGHHHYISALETLEDKDLIVSASLDKTLKVWNTNTYSCIMTIDAHNDPIQYAIALDNGNIASCGWDQIKIWNSKDNFKCIRTISLEGYDSFVKLLKLNNGKIVCPANRQGTPYLLIFDCTDPNYYVKICHSNTIMSLVNLCNNTFASVSKSIIRTISIWDADDDYKCIKTIGSHTGIEALIFNKRDLLISGSFDKNIKVWSISNGYQCVKEIKVNDQVVCLLLLPGGYFASAMWNGEVKIWDMGSFSCINVFRGHAQRMACLLLLSDYRIAYGSLDRSILIWDYYINLVI